ncbi:ABC transporter substrate-binding protein [uncultured Roseobacter sp.]|uniref:ABC transporter substrate-binding protein n=1 Tax=uncultured Roseobacter sp. TaxID=114847 RepID=UPI00261BE57F|nr:ABC transporter substrate-binding protein [uncultured Roseobacter sp.]
MIRSIVRTFTALCLVMLASAFTPVPGHAAPGDLLTETVTAPVRDCAPGWNTNMPLIAWGADGIVAHANGNSLSPNDGPLSAANLPLELTVRDDFAGQVNDYVSCASPFLRGTLGMLVSAAPVTEADARTEQVIFFKHSFSAGDGIVASEDISRAADLAGKRVAIQANGPHVDFVGRVLQDAGLSFDDIEIVWTQALTGDGDTPANALANGQADAAAVILPDARFLTSGGAVGTGAEGSVRGAKILISTQEAASVIGDYIAVRADYFDAHRDDIASLVNILFNAEEDMRSFMARDGDSDRTAMAQLMADAFLGGLPQEEGVFLWQDAITDGWSGNAKHFADPKEPRRFSVLLDEVNLALKGAGRVQRAYNLAIAEWDFASLTEGLDDLTERQIAAFDPEAAAAAVTRLRRTGQLEANTKIDFSVFFEPDSTSFPVNLYADDFAEILRLASTYSGAIITVEGHSDPLHYLRREKDGAAASELRAIRSSTQNLSLDRAIKVVDALESYAESEGVRINRNQFTVDGVGISAPAFNPPTTQEEWRQNMRVIFRVLTTQAEATTFAPL